MKHIILKTDDTTALSIDPTKTIFWIGAGASGQAPCSLPLGNGLTDVIMEAALGKENADTLIRLWNTDIQEIKGSIQSGDWLIPRSRRVIKRVPDPMMERPRLEFIMGEVHKLDIEFQNVLFKNDHNRDVYRRHSVVRSLRHFSSAKPNKYHYALADFANNGAEMVTANFDVCIEKALMGVDTISDVEESYGVKAVRYEDGRFVYHIHGVAADKDIETNLGATLTNVSKSLPNQFTDQLKKYFADGYTIVFIGYGGVDFFDVKPFFDYLGTERFPGRAIYLHYCQGDVSKETVGAEKHYQYLLTPFQEQIICYGDTEQFLKILMDNCGMHWVNRMLSSAKGHALQNMEDELAKAFEGRSKDAQEKYWFLNTFRIASQLSIHPRRFYPDWAKRLKEIYFEWKEDDSEQTALRSMILDPDDMTKLIVQDINLNNWYSLNWTYRRILRDIRAIFRERMSTSTAYSEISRDTLPEQVDEVCRILESEETNPPASALESAVVQYLCGRRTLLLWIKWMLIIPRRNIFREELREILKYIDQLLQYPCNHFVYMSFYLSLSRKRHLLNTILVEKTPSIGKLSARSDVFNSKTKTFGDLQHEWNLCMEIPNFFDARRTLQNILYQYICRLFRMKWISPWRAVRIVLIDLHILVLLIG